MIKSWWSVILIGLCILLGAGILFLVTRPPRGEPVILLPAPTRSPITVSVRGAVKAAGMYSLPAGSRVNDAINAAGGFAENANASALNLARLLSDGEQIDVPSIATQQSAGGENEATTSSPELVNINTASLEQLDTLPEIGPITAQQIIDYRITHGPFTRLEDILDVDGVGQVTFDKIKDLITLGDIVP